MNDQSAATFPHDKMAWAVLLLGVCLNRASGALLTPAPRQLLTPASRQCRVGSVRCCAGKPSSPAVRQLYSPAARQGRVGSLRCCVAEDAPAAVAQWCVDSGDAEASVMVSAATGLADAMRDFWYVTHSIGLQGPEEKGSIALAFPNWAEATQKPQFFRRVFDHIGSCSQLSEVLGEEVMCLARHPAMDGDTPPPYPTMLLRSFARNNDFGPDDIFDDEYFGGEDPFAALEARLAAEEAPPPTPVSDEEVLQGTYRWVEAVIVKMKVCPFSSSVERAGLPAGGVTYPLSRATTVEELYQAFWEQVLELRATDERTLSTVLLVAPEFAPTSPGGFDAFADTLNEALGTLKLEEELQLVFFHPGYTFRDGKQRLGAEGEAANYARRSPFPMINLLRTPQVRPRSRQHTNASGSGLSHTYET